MTSRRSNQRSAFGRQSEDKDRKRPGSHKFKGERSTAKSGATDVNRPKPGKAQQDKG